MTSDWGLVTSDWGLVTSDWGLGTGDWGLKATFGHRPIKKAAKPPPYQHYPHGEGGTASAVDRALSYAPQTAPLFLLYFPLSFIPCLPIRSPVSSSRAQPRDLYCTAAIGTHTLSFKRHLGASFFAFLSPTIYRSARSIPLLRPHDTQEKRIVSHPLSYRCVELCLSEALYPAPLARPFSKGLLVS